MCSTAQEALHTFSPRGANFPPIALTSRNAISTSGSGGSMRGGAVSRIMAVVLALACALVGGGTARAAQYRVSACGASANYVNHLFSASTSDDRMSAYTACPNDGSGHLVGMTALAGIDRGKVPVFANAIQSFTA